MKRRLNKFLSAITLSLFLAAPLIALPAKMALADPNAQFNQICSDPNAASSPICKDAPSTDPLTNGGSGILDDVTNVIALVAGVAAVIMIIVGGLMYVLSGGESQRVNSAKNTILFAIIGIVVILSLIHI